MSGKRIVLTDKEARTWLARLRVDPTAPPPTPDEAEADRTGHLPRSAATHGGKRADLGGQYFRSAWEANYARYLAWLVTQQAIRDWAYEPETFEFPVRRGPASFYTPDFKVWEADGRVVYHEVKGWMSPTSAAKLRRFARYYPQHRLVLIDADSYHALARDVAPLIPTWEHNR